MSSGRCLLRGAFLLLFAALTAGCAGPRLVSCDATGGIVAMPANTDCWPCYHRRNAEKLMRERFPGGYVVEKEEEAVVGTTQITHTNTDRKGDALLAALRIAPVTETTNQTTTSTNQTEWRIYFRKAPAGEVSPR